MRSDSWGWRARFGILVIHRDAVPEAEMWALAPAGVTLHAARFESPRRSGSDYTGDPGRALADSPDIARGLDFLGQMWLDAICVCFGSSSFFGGYGFDGGFVTEASKKAAGTPVTTAAAAMTEALRATGIRRPFLVVSPWFTDSVVSATERYFTEAGFEIAGQHPFDLGPGWREMPAYEIYDRGGQWTVRPEEVYRQIRRACPPDADGILIPGSGFRSLETIEPLEQDLGIPVVTSNQACLWQCLRMAKVAGSVDGGGRLFTRPLPATQ